MMLVTQYLDVLKEFALSGRATMVAPLLLQHLSYTNIRFIYTNIRCIYTFIALIGRLNRHFLSHFHPDFRVCFLGGEVQVQVGRLYHSSSFLLSSLLRYLPPSTFYPPPSILHPPSSTHHPLPDTLHPLPDTSMCTERICTRLGSKLPFTTMWSFTTTEFDFTLLFAGRST